MHYTTLSGTPREIGLQKAAADGNQVDAVLERHFNHRITPAFMDWVHTHAIPTTERNWSWIAEELAGYAAAMKREAKEAEAEKAGTTDSLLKTITRPIKGLFKKE